MLPFFTFLCFCQDLACFSSPQQLGFQINMSRAAQNVTAAADAPLTPLDEDLEKQTPSGNGNGQHHDQKQHTTDDVVEKQSPFVVDWAIDDPENPYNWPTKQKVTSVGIIAFITLITYVILQKNLSCTLHRLITPFKKGH